MYKLKVYLLCNKHSKYKWKYIGVISVADIVKKSTKWTVLDL